MASVSDGFSRAMDEFACPMGMQYRMVNYYAFSTVTSVELTGETMDERVERYRTATAKTLPRMSDLWEREWLPSILSAIERARTTDYTVLDGRYS